MVSWPLYVVPIIGDIYTWLMTAEDNMNPFSIQVRKFAIPRVHKICSLLPNLSFATTFSSTCLQQHEIAPSILCSDLLVSDAFLIPLHKSMSLGIDSLSVLNPSSSL
jgi:hypothetical protein